MNELIMTTLCNLVKSIREKQTEYFKTRDKQTLLEAKYLEQKVDSKLYSLISLKDADKIIKRLDKIKKRNSEKINER